MWSVTAGFQGLFFVVVVKVQLKKTWVAIIILVDNSS